MTISNINRDAQLSTIANAAYLDAPKNNHHRGGAWTYVTDSGPSTSGFFGVTYRNPLTNEVAIAYLGTDGRAT